MGKPDPGRLRDPCEPATDDPKSGASDANANADDELEHDFDQDDPWSGHGPPRGTRPPHSVREALDRAAHHGKAAVAETLAALRALLDAAALARTGRPADADTLLGPLTSWLEDLGAKLASDAGDTPPAVLSALADALDHEISRWEQRARSDPEARAVLRAFLGVRELLWEFGVRRAEADDGAHADPPDSPPERPGRVDRAARGKARRSRVQRIRVEG